MNVDFKKEDWQVILSLGSVERVWQELEKTDKDGKLADLLLSLYDWELLKEVFPRMKETYKYSNWKRTYSDIKEGVRKSKETISKKNFFEKEMKNLPSGLQTITKIVSIFNWPNLKEWKEFCDYYKIPNQDRELVYLLADYRTYSGGTLALMDKKLGDLHLYMPNARKLETVDWIEFYANPNSQIFLEIIFRDRWEKSKSGKRVNKWLDFHKRKRKKYNKLIESARKYYGIKGN